MKNKIEEIKKLLDEILESKNKTYKQGDTLKFKGLEWYVIKDNGSTIDLLPTKVLSEELIKKNVTDEIMRDDFEVRMTDTIRPISWKESFIYKKLLPKIKEDFEAENVTLLSKEEIEALPLECATRFAYVSGDGVSDGWYASNALGVRPLVSINKDLLEGV